MVYVQEILAGSLGGAAGVVIGQPLDLLKVTQQQKKQKGNLSVLFDIIKTNGYHSLFKGVIPPICGGVVYQGLMFPSYQLGLYLQGKGKLGSGKGDETLLQSSLAGTFAGLVTTIGTTPLEVVKIKLQLDPDSDAGKRGATTKELLKLMKKGKLYTGWSAMACRDGPGTGVYMATYFSLKSLGDSYSSWKMLNELFSGGLAGVICWLAVLPFDTVKTRMQFDAGSKNVRYQGVISGLFNIVKTEGVPALYLGWKAVSLRAFPVNAVTFFVYERCLGFLSGIPFLHQGEESI